MFVQLQSTEMEKVLLLFFILLFFFWLLLKWKACVCVLVQLSNEVSRLPALPHYLGVTGNRSRETDSFSFSTTKIEVQKRALSGFSLC